MTIPAYEEVLALVKRAKEEGSEEYEKHARLAAELTEGRKFIPSPGPQTEAYYSKADVLLYGGQAGGGKSALLNGLALNEHKRSRILRRRFADLGALTEDLIRFNGSRKGFVSSPRPKLRTDDDRLVEFGACQHLGDEQSYQGQPVDLLGFDEATQFLEIQVRYLMGWVRTTEKGQRTRVILATNPPLSAEGDWIIGMFRPWLDPSHPNPAAQGELRWFITDEHGKDEEVDGPDPVERSGRMLKPMSRTFISASVNDNPYLANTDYQAKLDALPEPLRSAARDGNFMAVRADDACQVIPSDLIRAAQARWKPEPYPGIPMTAIGVDVARGGKDDTVLARRFDGWFAPLIVLPGRETPEGTDVAAQVVKHRRDQADVIIDMGGGYGGAPYEHLKRTIGPEFCHEFMPGSSATGTTETGGYRFFNKRAQAWWMFREALDPANKFGDMVQLPANDPMIMADLTAPRFDPEFMARGIIKLESKDEIKKRLGRSPDRGDAIVMAWFKGQKGLATHATWNAPVHRQPASQQRRGTVVDKYANRRRR